MADASENVSARELVALAVRTHGRKRGWHIAAALLGVTERWCKSAAYGEPVAPPDPIRAEAARVALAQQRAAQLRAELADLTRSMDDAPLANDSRRREVVR